MSTYYGFICNKCKQRGGFFSRQMWGWGNCDVIENMKFLSYHTEKCGSQSLRVSSEHDDLYDFQEMPRKQFISETKDILPSSNDWEIVKNNKWSNGVQKAWEKQYRAFEDND